MLVVDVRSFGFRQSGIPSDPSEHGGGFVFDCRSLPNPGRERAYKHQTGLDASVQDYLNAQPQVHDFHLLCLNLVRLSISSFLERGFDRIMVNYGCTGGQHRSVFFCERLKSDLHKIPEFRDQIQVVVSHMEQEKWP